MSKAIRPVEVDAAMSVKSEEVYRETYKKGSMVVRRDLLPERFPYMKKDHHIVGIEVLSAGRMDDGREFQNVRVYSRESTDAKG